MKISKSRPVLIYCTSIETVDSYIDLQKIRDCNVVGICTDEYILESLYREYPIIREDRIAEFENAVMISLDDDIPNTFQKAALSANIAIEALALLCIIYKKDPLNADWFLH